MAQSLIDQGTNNPDLIAPRLETVVRSYDPCVSCSVHVTMVK
jgi:coenzyme F420-reducing hydrogenase alpha subunit